MNCNTMVLNTPNFHRLIHKYIISAIHASVEQSIEADRIPIKVEPLETLHQTQWVCNKLDKVFERFYTHQIDIVRWFYEMELGLLKPPTRGHLTTTQLGFHGIRIHRASIHCDFLKPSTVKAMLDNAKEYAARQVMPESKWFTTGDVLSFYFDHYMRVNLYEYKIECARKLKEIHQETIEQLPEDPFPVNWDLFDDEGVSLGAMLHGAKHWLDDLDFGVDITEPIPPTSSPSPPKKRGRPSTK